MAGATGSLMPDMVLTGSPIAPNCDPAIQPGVASLATTISFAITKVSGALALQGFRLPRGFRGVFIVIPTGAFTGVTGGTLAYSADGLTEDIPFGLAFTAVPGKVQFFVSNGLLVYPSY
jgi:hypothetical protein